MINKNLCFHTKNKRQKFKSTPNFSLINKGEVLTFFDAHVGWLSPILARIASDRFVVAVPVIGRISSYDLSYTLYTEPFGITGFR